MHFDMQNEFNKTITNFEKWLHCEAPESINKNVSNYKLYARIDYWPTQSCGFADDKDDTPYATKALTVVFFDMRRIVVFINRKFAYWESRDSNKSFVAKMHQPKIKGAYEHSLERRNVGGNALD